MESSNHPGERVKASVKRVAQVFNYSLRDVASTHMTSQDLKTWLAMVNKSGLPVKFKAWIYKHGIFLWSFGSSWSMKFQIQQWKALRGG